MSAVRAACRGGGITLPRSLAFVLILVAILVALAAGPAARGFDGPGPTPVESQPARTGQANAGQQGQAYTLPPEKLAKAIELNRIRLTLEIASSVWGLLVLWLLLRLRIAARMELRTERSTGRRWLQGLIFFALFLVITFIADLPFGIIGHAASLHYGISIQKWPSWTVDQAKALGLAVAIGAPVLLLFNWIVRSWPRRFWLIAWAITIPLMIAGTLASPLFERLFDQFEPLSKSHPQLVQKLEEVVARTGTRIPPDRMYLMKASAKTNALNAYVSGLGATKRVVVWDTTAGRVPDDEIMFIFGHETGHYVLHHIVKGLIASSIFLFFVYWGCARIASSAASRYGARWGLPHQPGTIPLATRTGFVVLIFVVSIAGFILEPIGNAFSRHQEHEADIYGQEAIHGLVPNPQKTTVAAFQALGEATLDDPHPNPFIEFWLYDHPSVQARANFAAQYDPWRDGGHGRFFAK